MIVLQNHFNIGSRYGFLFLINCSTSFYNEPRHTAIFFDELENSLGINCLDSVVERIRLKAAEEGTQFLLTSHHPYIINQIPVSDWLLISQDKGIITSKKAADVGIGRTGREQFMDLLNFVKRLQENM